MTLSIIILAYYLWMGDIVRAFDKGKSELLGSSSLITLLSWQQNTAWGIVMCCVGAVLVILALAKKKK